MNFHSNNTVVTQLYIVLYRNTYELHRAGVGDVVHKRIEHIEG